MRVSSGVCLFAPPPPPHLDSEKALQISTNVILFKTHPLEKLSPYISSSLHRRYNPPSVRRFSGRLGPSLSVLFCRSLPSFHGAYDIFYKPVWLIIFPVKKTVVQEDCQFVTGGKQLDLFLDILKTKIDVSMYVSAQRYGRTDGRKNIPSLQVASFTA